MGKVIGVTRTHVAAARLRIACDQQLGRETPPWIMRVAAARKDNGHG